MKISRRWLRVILAGGLLLVGSLVVVVYLLLPSGVHYRWFGDEASLNRALATMARPGMARDDVRALLGPGTVPAEPERQRLLKATADFVEQTPDSRPDGVEPDDQFLGYDFGSAVLYLQFRGGCLINFDPRDYESPAQFMATSPP